ncbi:interleukin 17-like protein [Haliotis rubra]|uniref:interleukin 17-like protein n=1 Tax=Haliotis rubra TaxID=36100 RepID=UPI001EE6151F|nr:interleukin 17-like protein [Haliotis rubra]
MEAITSPSSSRHVVKLLLALMSCVTAQHTHCREAGNMTELMDRFNRLNPGMFLHYNPHGPPNGGTPSTDSPTLSCPRSLGDPSAGVNDKALCPWTTRVVPYPGQLPPYLVEAECLCSRCVEKKGFSCERVTYSIWVLQQTGECSSGVQVYRKAQKEVTVGCTCVNARTN